MYIFFPLVAIVLREVRAVVEKHARSFGLALNGQPFLKTLFINGLSSCKSVSYVLLLGFQQFLGNKSNCSNIFFFFFLKPVPFKKASSRLKLFLNYSRFLLFSHFVIYCGIYEMWIQMIISSQNVNFQQHLIKNYFHTVFILPALNRFGLHF